MTEAEWLASDDPERLLAALGYDASERRFRLIGCAACRARWDLMTDARHQTAVEAAEGDADGSVTLDALARISLEIRGLIGTHSRDDAREEVVRGVERWLFFLSRRVFDAHELFRVFEASRVLEAVSGAFAATVQAD